MAVHKLHDRMALLQLYRQMCHISVHILSRYLKKELAWAIDEQL